MVPHNKNYGACGCAPRKCKYTAERCEWGYCEECCTTVHMGMEIGSHHFRPWAPVASVMGFHPINGATGVLAEIAEEIQADLMKEDKATTNDVSKLPAIYQPKPSKPEPRPLKEDTDVGDIMLNRGDRGIFTGRG